MIMGFAIASRYLALFQIPTFLSCACCLLNSGTAAAFVSIVSDLMSAFTIAVRAILAYSGIFISTK